MAITEHPPQQPTCYRVYTSWGPNKKFVHQHYISFIQNGKRSKRKALVLAKEKENALEERRKDYRAKRCRTGDDLLKSNGRIRGISIVTSRGTDYFQCQLGTPPSVQRCNRSIKAHGAHGAFSEVLEFYFRVRNIKDKKIRKRLRGCFEKYDV